MRRPTLVTLPAELRPLCLALAALGPGFAGAQSAAPANGIELRAAPELQAPPRGDAARQLPIILQADEVRGRPDLETIAEGHAEFRRGGVSISSDRLTYEHADDLAIARGKVRISRDGNIYRGDELQLKVQSFEGFFLNPSYLFARTGAGGSAQRIDFLDQDRAVAKGATYTSCPADGSGGPAWLLSTSSVKFDFAANEGVAENAVLRFYGVPILAAPVLSFPLSDERKSGWLPPSLNLDNKSGLQVSVPYYWNIAPNRDATITPTLSTRRGAGADTEFRYLEPRYSGSLALNLLPNDQLIGHTRYSLNLAHDAALPEGIRLQARALRVSDDDYWKDFPRGLPTLTPRLLETDAQLSRPFGDWQTYARMQSWQVLQTADVSSRIEAPYERAPQVGARLSRRIVGGFEIGLETELNRFVDPVNGTSAPRPTGLRAHVLGSIGLPLVSPGWTVTPKLSFNAASYALDQPLADGRTNASRIIPTLSVDSGWVFERDTAWFGQAARQTLEPRLLYVNTPYQRQDLLPNFDSAAKDFNFESIFSENSYTGVDRVADAHQLTAGVTTRVLDPTTGAERLRLGVVQRYLLRDQRVTIDGQPLTQRFSDLLLLGSTTLVRNWTLDASLQYSPDTRRAVRSILGARFSPGPFRTVGATYRLNRGVSEQLEIGWQWPLYGSTPQARGSAMRDTRSCSGSWYTVGRINYSTRDSRITDSLLGFEYDAGCWIGRVVSERLSTGRSEATTRLLLQLELVGLSRLGSNPLQVLKDNIPGYQLLREDRAAPAPSSTYE